MQGDNSKHEQFLKGLQKTLEGGAVQPAELIAVVKVLLTIVRNLDEKITKNITAEKTALHGRVDATSRSISEQALRLERLIGEAKKDALGEISKRAQTLLNSIRDVASRIPEPEDPDFTDVWTKISQVEAKIPTDLQKLDGEDIRNFLEALNGEDRLRMEAIDGLIEALQELKNRPQGVVKGGTPQGLRFYIDGIKKGLLSTMDFVAGDGMAISYSKVNGQDTITFESTGGGGPGGGVEVEVPGGTVNASNTVFTVSAEPKYVVADGTTYFDGAGYTYAALSITMDVAPSASIRAII